MTSATLVATRARSLVAPAIELVCLGATPLFGLMAILTALIPPDMTHGHGSMHPGAWGLNGMSTMYLLMSLFHSAPWLKRIVGVARAGGGGSSGRGMRSA